MIVPYQYLRPQFHQMKYLQCYQGTQQTNTLYYKLKQEAKANKDVKGKKDAKGKKEAKAGRHYGLN